MAFHAKDAAAVHLYVVALQPGPPGLGFPAFFALSCNYHHRQLQHAGLQDAAVVDSFLCALRNLYDSRGTHCLHAVMLAGVDSLHWVLDEHNAR